MEDNDSVDEAVVRLTRAMKRGDESAWRSFHESRYDDLRRVALARGVPEADVADVIQRCYLRILKHIRTFDSEDDLRAWCLCLLRSEIIDAGRSRGRRVSKLERFKTWAVERVAHWVVPDPLEGIAAPDRVLLEKHYVEGWSQAELAAEAGVSVKAMESRMARVRQRARRSLQSDELSNHG